MSRRRDLAHHRVPAWWADAKLGIFVHWTPASVAGWAPVDVEIGDVLISGRADPMGATPYTEWYENSLRFPDSPASRYHRETYGNRPYAAFGEDFRAGLEAWDPDEWARRFAATGARYVVLVTKHHDGFCLWPSEVSNPHRSGWHAGRDVVGELGEAVRGAGMRFGVYYSGGLDWTFNAHPIGTVADLALAIPRGDYPDYADAQVRELIRRYRPSVLWNDIAWPAGGEPLRRLFTDYYAAVPDGVVNDRFLPWSPVWDVVRFGAVRRGIDALAVRQARAAKGIVPPKPPHFDVRTPEYTTFDHVPADPWECVRGIDRSFGYNRASEEEHRLTRDELLWSFSDIVATGGNLLLNVGPRGEDATIPEPQQRRLEWLGAWTAAHADAVIGTRPWVRPAAVCPEGPAVRFTSRDRWVHALVHGPVGARVTLPGVGATPTTEVHRDGAPLPFRPVTGGLQVTLDRAPGDEPGPIVLTLRDVDALATVD